VSVLMHPTYLPFTEQQLRMHFVDVASGGEADRHLAYYRSSLKDAATYAEQLAESTSPTVTTARGLQLQKDERFWVVSALMSIFHGADPIAELCGLLTRCFGPTPSLEGATSWQDALGPDPKLYFEVNLPSPREYRKDLADRLDERVLIPHMRTSALASGARLEGATKVDAMLVSSTGFAVAFEAKVLSDASTSVRYDVLHNQLARNVDVLLEANPQLSTPLDVRLPERTFLALITPEVFKKHPSSRLYGWLMPRYQDAESRLLNEHLPRRNDDVLAAVSQRLAWISWEDINLVHPGACSRLLA